MKDGGSADLGLSAVQEKMVSSMVASAIKRKAAHIAKLTNQS